MRPTSDDVVAIVTGTGDDRRWYFKSSYGDAYAEDTALTFNEAVEKVARFAGRLNVGGYVETIAGKTWYPVGTAAAQIPPPSPETASLPLWITSKRTRRKATKRETKNRAEL